MPTQCASTIDSTSPTETTSRRDITHDTIGAGLSRMLVANVVQRGIGFIRNLAFCHFLSQQHLGLWALASSFFILAAPLAVLGLPGSLGRYVESFRRNGQLAGYIKRIGWVSGCSAILFCTGLMLASHATSEIIFGTPLSVLTTLVVSVTLFAVILFNFLVELLGGLRQSRVVSSMQMVNSMSFTLLSLTWLSISDSSWFNFSETWFCDRRGIVIAFGLAAILGSIPGLRALAGPCRNAFADHDVLESTEMWQRIVPFAMSIWLMNLLSNLFDIVDRYMLLHLAVATTAHGEIMDGQSIVGQYHSGRLLPVLLTSLASMISAMLLPYLSSDWEAGRIHEVRLSIRRSYKFVTLFFWGLSIGGMSVAPLLFTYLLGGRYTEGLDIMPLALVHCTFSALILLLHNFFWCAEQGRKIAFLLSMGLLLNIAMNYWLVPLLHVRGAMIATTFSGFAVLAVSIHWLNERQCPIGTKAIVLSLLPLTLLWSTSLSMLVFTGTLLVISRTDLLLDKSEKDLLASFMEPLLKKLPLNDQRIWSS